MGLTDTDVGPDCSVRAPWVPGPSPQCQEPPHNQQMSLGTVEGPWRLLDRGHGLSRCPIVPQPQPLPFPLTQNPKGTERRTQDSQRELKHSLFNFYTFFSSFFCLFFFFLLFIESFMESPLVSFFFHFFFCIGKQTNKIITARVTFCKWYVGRRICKNRMTA